MATVIIGNQVTHESWRTIEGNANQQGFSAALFFVPADTSGFITKIGGWSRSPNSDAKCRFFLYTRNPNGSPGTLIAYTYEVSVGSVARYWEQYVQWSALGTRPDGGVRYPRFTPGMGYVIGVHVRAGRLDLGLAPRTGGGAVYWRTNNSNLPQSPFPIDGSGGIGNPGLYAVLEENPAPVVDEGTLTPAAGANFATLTPTFAGAVIPGGESYGDFLYQYAIQVRELSSPDMLWDGTGASSFMASASEQSSNAFARVYAGPPLVEGRAYEWRVRPTDAFGLSGEWSAWRGFGTTAAGYVDLTGATPAGKLESGVVTPYTAIWRSPGVRKMTAAQVRLLTSSGAEIATSPVIAVSPAVDNNAAFGLTNAQVGWGTTGVPLPPGPYQWQAIGRDEDGAWGAWPAEAVPFVVNAPPAVPALWSPISGAQMGERPVLEFVLTDPDTDDVPGVDVVGFVEITKPGGGTVTVQVNTVDPVTGRFAFQTTAAEVPDGLYGIYTWRAIGYDVSAGVYSQTYSPTYRFDYQPAATIAVTQPGSVVTTSAPIVQWTIPAGGPITSYRVEFYRADEPDPFFSSQWQPVEPAADAAAFQLPAGWLVNKLPYDFVVDVVNSSGVESSTGRRRITVNYPSVTAINGLQASLEGTERDWELSRVLLSWGATTINPARFAGYVVRRRLPNQGIAESVPIARIVAPTRTRFVDAECPPNQAFIYSVTQLERVGGDYRESSAVEALVEVALSVPTLTDVDNADVHAAIAWLNVGQGGGFERPVATYNTWGGGGAPTVIETPQSYGKATVNLDFTIRSDHRGAMMEHFADVERLVRTGGVKCYRSETERLYVRVAKWAWKRGKTPGTRQLSLGLEEVAYTEAVKIPA